MKRFLSLFLCFAIAVSCFCFATVSADANLSTDKAEYGVGEAIMVTATGSGKDWVGIYPASDPIDGSKTSIYWYYVADYGSGNAVNIKNTTMNADRSAWASIPIGDYKVVLYSNDSYNVVSSVDVSVVEVDNTSTTYDIKVNGNEVTDGEVLTVTNDGDINLQPTFTGGPAGEAWVGVYHAYYGKLTPYENASGNMTDYKYVSSGSWNLSGVLWSGRSTVVLFGDGGYSKVLKVFYIQFDGFKEADFNLNGKEVANDSVVTLYKGYEQAVLNMTLGTGTSHGDPWYTVYNDVAGSSEIDYSGYGYGDWDYVSSGDKDITSKLKEGKNTVVIYGNEKYNDIRKCIVIDYVTPDFNVDVDTLEAASIRLNNPTGIRFYSTVDADKIAELVAHGATVETGTLIGPADLNADAMTLETDEAKVVNVKFNLNNKDGYFTDNAGFEGIVGSIVNINSGNIARDFIGRGYVKVTYNGDTIVSYSDTVSTRSLRTVAQSCQLDTVVYDNLSDSIKALVDAWASAPDFE